MRLIDADALKQLMIDTLLHINENPKMDGQEAHLIAGMHMLGEMIDDAPTIEAVPIDLINQIIEADGSEDQSNAISLLSLIDTWKYVKRKEERAKHETD